MAHSRRVKAFRIDPEAIAYLLQGRAMLIPLPEDVEVIRYHVQWETNSALIVLESQSYDEVPEGHTIRVENLQLRTIPPVNYHDLANLYSLLCSQIGMKEPCRHEGAIERDRYGVYFLKCSACGTFGMTDEAGARRLGWLL